MAKTYTVKLKDRDVVVTAEQIKEFRDLYINSLDFADRISNLLALDLYIFDAHFGISPLGIINELRSLEGGSANSFTKKATLYKRPPLQGLWHKHFFAPENVLQNIFNASGGYDNFVKGLVDRIIEAKRSRTNIMKTIKDEFEGPLEKRSENKKATGHWIVFTRHDEKNYYLCANAHDADNQLIYDRIAKHCTCDFPDLLAWIEAEAKKLK